MKKIENLSKEVEVIEKEIETIKLNKQQHKNTCWMGSVVEMTEDRISKLELTDL